MSVKDFIESEKTHIQGLFDCFNRDGSWMTVRDRDYQPLELWEQVARG